MLRFGLAALFVFLVFRVAGAVIGYIIVDAALIALVVTVKRWGRDRSIPVRVIRTRNHEKINRIHVFRKADAEITP